ncbi:unnamed protein product [Durusdinium trenchii]|uniref:Uncharacterized protein n=1 Tax=Durusdinium trenchii TaxID=1381693 RepID=A0ABP0P1K1_9DINO
MDYFSEKPLGTAGATPTSGGAPKAKGKGKGPPPPKGGMGMPDEVRAKLREDTAPKAAPKAAGGMSAVFNAIGGFNTGTLKKAPDSGVRGAVPQVNYGGRDFRWGGAVTQDKNGYSALSKKDQEAQKATAPEPQPTEVKKYASPGAIFQKVLFDSPLNVLLIAVPFGITASRLQWSDQAGFTALPGCSRETPCVVTPLFSAMRLPVGLWLLAALSAGKEELEETLEHDSCSESMEMLQRRSRVLNETLPGGRLTSSVQCAETPVCHQLKLEGYCCPGSSGQSLDCCFNKRHQQIRQCLQVGREQLMNCPPHVDAQTMRPEDVEKVCEDACLEELLPLSVNCGVTNFARTFDRLCANPKATAEALREISTETECMNRGLKTSFDCPPHINIIREIFQAKHPKDVDILCKSGCYKEFNQLTEVCMARRFHRQLHSLRGTQKFSKKLGIRSDQPKVEEMEEEMAEDELGGFFGL